MGRFTRHRDQRGFALSSPVALLSAGAVVLAGVTFVVTGGRPEAPVVPVADQGTAAPTTQAPQPVIEPTEKPTRKKRPAVRRGETYVEVYNNSGISGLAGSTAARAQGAGWQVVGSDNWYGTIPTSTVYYPPRLRDAAKLLARDLGVDRLRPAIEPMRFDRLTVILTSDYSG